ncbi:VOC family protein [Paenibacillus harenae]|uniref:VOC family protein n=1 Tax=Paenibacillus harenae TaxID=306543 RepID=UPI0004293ED6|nr:VOC family protein [Paenibacillus harenae]
MIKGLYEAHLPVSDLDRSIRFYESLGLELAHRTEGRAFFWIEKGRSWLALWVAEQVNILYHVSIRHTAFLIELEDIDKAKEWLQERNIDVVNFYEFEPFQQPVVPPLYPQVHAAVYFEDPDGNLLELIAPVKLDVQEYFETIELDKWIQMSNKLEN